MKPKRPSKRGDFQTRQVGAVHSFFVCPICGENHSKAEHPAEHISPSMTKPEGKND